MAEFALELQRVTKLFGERAVLSDVDLRVPRGGLVALTGRSGSGKSTLFRLVAGLERPTSGRILLEGRDIAVLSDREMSQVRLRRMGIVFQSLNLLPDLTVHRNVRLPLDIAGAPRRLADEKAAGLLRLVGLAGFAARTPESLSGGEAQRVAFARALANDPAIILADEPTASLDSVSAHGLVDALLEIHKARGTTILITTHDPIVRARFPRIVSIDDGRIVQPSPRGAEVPSGG